MGPHYFPDNFPELAAASICPGLVWLVLANQSGMVAAAQQWRKSAGKVMQPCQIRVLMRGGLAKC